MARLVSLWLPQFAIERYRIAHRPTYEPHDEAPTSQSGPHNRAPALAPNIDALVGQGPRGPILTALRPELIGSGFYVGMGLADARALRPDLHCPPAEPAADHEALIALAQWCGRYSPRTQADPPDGLWLDIAGSAHLFGGEMDLLADIVKRLNHIGFSARVALADSLAAAWALARFAPHDHPGANRAATIAHAHTVADRLAYLPVAALAPAPDAARLLHRSGLRRIGQLYPLPRASLAARFGPTTGAGASADAVLDRLDRALGRKPEALCPLAEPAEMRVVAHFPSPLIHAQGVERALAHLSRRLAEALSRVGQGAKQVNFQAFRADGGVFARAIALRTASAAPAHLLSLLTPHLASLDAGSGLDAMALSAPETAPLAPLQTSLAGATCPATLDGLIDRLTNRLGAAAVLRTHVRAHPLPEAADRLSTAIAPPPADPLLLPGHGAPAPAKSAPNRPSRLFEPPERADVIAGLPEGPPAQIVWRRRIRRIIRAQGPERIAQPWWETPALVHGRAAPDDAPDHARPAIRDYYRIEDDQGGQLWVFRAGLYSACAEAQNSPQPQWYVHGLFH